MAIYRVYFFGLIMHIERNGKGHSAVLHDPDHAARLMFGRDDVVDLTSIHSIEIVARDLPMTPANRKDSFDSDVPSAEEVLGGSLQIASGFGVGSKATFLHHVGGSLCSMGCYAVKAHYFSHSVEIGPARCVSKLVQMEFKSKETVAIKVGPISRVLMPERCLLLANFGHEIPNHDPEKDPHIRKYATLTNSSDTGVTLVEEAGACSLVSVPADCQWVIDVINDIGACTAAHPECGNSSWP